jgi:hypothetical protein
MKWPFTDCSLQIPHFLLLFTFTFVSLHIYKSDNFQCHILPFKLHPSHLFNLLYYIDKFDPFQGHRTLFVLHCPHWFSQNSTSFPLFPVALLFFSHVTYFPTLKMEGVGSCDTSVLICQDCMTSHPGDSICFSKVFQYTTLKIHLAVGQTWED